jgi:hypothetical protein
VHRKFKVYWFLHCICATAVSDGLFSPNPCQLNVVKPELVVKPVILEPDAAAAAVKQLEPQRFRAPALIAAWCILRWGEFGGCRIDMTKSGKARTADIPQRI